ncbi:molybdopterin-dependent oxidoreductase [Thermodesulfobacteriota bacterium]
MPLALQEGTYRNDQYPMLTRFLNLFGNPGSIGCAGMICYCNTVALSYALIGCAPGCPNMHEAQCVVVHGNDISQSVPLDWFRLKKHVPKKTKLIIIDHKKTEMGKYADMWLQLRPGTDTALLMAWINVIIEEGLYNKSFVSEWTFSFEELRKRASEYTPEKVAEITWVPAEQIRESARIYATSKSSVIKFGQSSPSRLFVSQLFPFFFIIFRRQPSRPPRSHESPSLVQEHLLSHEAPAPFLPIVFPEG